MRMNSMMAALIAAPVLGLAGFAVAVPISRDAKDLAVKDAASQYRADKTACEAFSGNTKDICMAEAKGRESVSKTRAEARFENTPKAWEAARVAPADAAFAVAKERCDDAAGTAKGLCLQEAKAAHVKALAEAKVERVTADAREDSAEKETVARHEASEDRRDADYKVATEKCEILAGTAKAGCLHDAKVQFSKL
jgi:hypothetical protein